ncbi:unnamed protein product, partial [Meganyctiphanes norvegica]
VTGREDGVINVHDPLVYIGVATSGISISYGATMFLADPSSITDALIKFFLTMITVGGRTLLCIWWGFQIINGKFYYNPFGINELGFILYLCTPGYALLALVMFNLGIKNFSKENETEETSLGQRVKQAGRTIGKLLIAASLDGVTVNGLIASLTYLIHYQLFTGISRTFRGIQKDHTIYLVITILLGSSVIVNMAFNIYKTIKNGKTTIHMFLKYVSTLFVISVRVLSFLFLICDAIAPMWWMYALPITSVFIVLFCNLFILIYKVINKYEVAMKFSFFYVIQFIGNILVCAIVDGVSISG